MHCSKLFRVHFVCYLSVNFMQLQEKLFIKDIPQGNSVWPIRSFNCYSLASCNGCWLVLLVPNQDISFTSDPLCIHVSGSCSVTHHADQTRRARTAFRMAFPMIHQSIWMQYSADPKTDCSTLPLARRGECMSWCGKVLHEGHVGSRI